MFYQYKGLKGHFYGNKTLFNFLTVPASVNSSNYRNFTLIHYSYTLLFLKHDNRINFVSASASEADAKQGTTERKKGTLQGTTTARNQESKTWCRHNRQKTTVHAILLMSFSSKIILTRRNLSLFERGTLCLQLAHNCDNE